MTAQPGSPNWYWEKLGAEIVRGGPKGLHRSVYVNGNLICEHVGYDVERETAKRMYMQSINCGGE